MLGNLGFWDGAKVLWYSALVDMLTLKRETRMMATVTVHHSLRFQEAC